jgi:iron complex transport system ATP-binding protein
VLTQELALEAFGLDAVIIDDPISGTPMVIPRSRQHR